MRLLRVGATLDQALLNIAARVGSKQLDNALSAVLIGRQVGGNLPKVLETTAAAIREMARLEGVVRTKTAEGKAQLWVLGALPMVLMLALNTMQPGYFDREFRTFKGGHAQVTDMVLKYDAMKGHKAQSLGWPGLGPNRWALVDIFPGITFNIRSPVMRIDTVIPIGPNKLFIEYRGLGLKSDTPEERAARVQHHNSISPSSDAVATHD